jgi:hypothetical protein
VTSTLVINFKIRAWKLRALIFMVRVLVFLQMPFIAEMLAHWIEANTMRLVRIRVV